MPTVKDIYGTDTPTAPEGYKLGEFRQLVKGERADWLDGSSKFHNVHFGKCRVNDNAGDWRYLLVPEQEGEI